MAKIGARLHAETNSTLEISQDLLQYLDWVTISPKTLKLKLQFADELKFIFLQLRLKPQDFNNIKTRYHYIQPTDMTCKQKIANKNSKFNNRHTIKNQQLAIEFCKQNPSWRLSPQLHKFFAIRSYIVPCSNPIIYRHS